MTLACVCMHRGRRNLDNPPCHDPGMDPLIGKTAKSKPLTGVDPLFELPQKFDSKAQANAAYHRIMTGAAQFQQMINFHVVNSARRPDPVERADSLDKAIPRGGTHVGGVSTGAERPDGGLAPCTGPADERDPQQGPRGLEAADVLRRTCIIPLPIGRACPDARLS